MIPHDLQLTTMFFRQGKTVISELAMFCTSKFGCPKPLVSSWKNDKFSDDVGVMVRTSFFRKGIGGSPCSSGNIQTSKRPWFLATQWRGDQALDWVWKWWIQHDTTPIYDHLWLRLFWCFFLLKHCFLTTGFGVPYFHGLRMTVLHVSCFVNEGTGL